MKSASVDYSATGTAVTSYTYDDYKRLRTVTTPQRFTGDSTSRTTNYYYALGGGATDDYTHTDSQPRLISLPSGKKTLNTYDLDFHLATTTAGSGTAEAATTGFGRDDAGNVTSRTEPKYHAAGGPSWIYSYDARDRLKSTDDPFVNHTTYTYDKASNKKSEVRANGQTITYIFMMG